MILRIALLVLVLLVSAALMLALLPYVKEGYDLNELPRFAGIALGLGVAAFLFWRAGKGTVRIAGLVILAAPFLIYSGLSAKLVFNWWNGHRLERDSHITSFRVMPIAWSGFDGPVGFRIELEVSHPALVDVALLPPKIAMTGAAGLAAKQYFSPLSEFERGFLQVPLFPIGHEFPRNILSSSPTRLVYEVYPSIIHVLNNPQRVCFWKDAERPAVYADGSNLAASWYLITRAGATVDLSRELTGRLRASGLPGATTSEEWTALLRRTEPAGVVKAGYQPCADSDPRATGERCYCR